MLLEIGLFILALYIFYKFIRYSCFDQIIEERGEGEYGSVRKCLKDAVEGRQRGRCNYHGCNQTENLELHHVVPRKFGGDNRLSNLMYLCPNHHAKTHNNQNYNDVPNHLKR
tara:strand:+ start:1047 stop:1382 length:336 start_codon:yes stop_codon:yes gene_type:complete